MPDLDVEYVKITDELKYQRDGTVAPVKVYRFFLGKYGPFTETVPAAPLDEQEIGRRVDALRQHLQAIIPV